MLASRPVALPVSPWQPSGSRCARNCACRPPVVTTHLKRELRFSSAGKCQLASRVVPLFLPSPFISWCPRPRQDGASPAAARVAFGGHGERSHPLDPHPHASKHLSDLKTNTHATACCCAKPWKRFREASTAAARALNHTGTCGNGLMLRPGPIRAREIPESPNSTAPSVLDFLRHSEQKQHRSGSKQNLPRHSTRACHSSS